MTEARRASLSTIQLPQATTNSDGGFRIDLDPALLQQATTYDLLWQPASGNWLHRDVDLAEPTSTSTALEQ